MRSLLSSTFPYSIAKDTGCWEWGGSTAGRGSTAGGGYGVLQVYGHAIEGTRTRPCVSRYAHRVSYEHYKGPIPDGYEIDHTCRNHRCVNPDHLEAVTHTENVHRGLVARGISFTPGKKPDANLENVTYRRKQSRANTDEVMVHIRAVSREAALEQVAKEEAAKDRRFAEKQFRLLAK